MGTQGIELLKDVTLNLIFLENGLHDHYNSLDGHLHVRRTVESGQNFIALGLRQLALLDLLAYEPLNITDSSVYEGLLRVDQSDCKTCFNSYLSDAGTHRTGSDHCYFFYHHSFPFFSAYLLLFSTKALMLSFCS